MAYSKHEWVERAFLVAHRDELVNQLVAVKAARWRPEMDPIIRTSG
jgi:hypothetical protein